MGAAMHLAFPAPSVFGRPLSSKTRVRSRRENVAGCDFGCWRKIAMSVAFPSGSRTRHPWRSRSGPM